MAAISEKSATFAQYGSAKTIRTLPIVSRRIIGAQIAHELGKPIAEKICSARAALDKHRFGDIEGMKRIMETHSLSHPEIDAVETSLLIFAARKRCKNPEIRAAMHSLRIKPLD